MIKRLLQDLPSRSTLGNDDHRAQIERINALNEYAHEHSLEGGALLAAGKNAAAERALSSALDRYPRMVPLRDLLAEALIRQGKDAEALSILLDLQDKQHLWNERSALRIALLRARLGQTQPSRAEWDPEIVMRYCEGLPEARASLPSVDSPRGLETAWTIAAGYLADLHGDDAGAAFYYARALALDPKNAFVNLKVGDLELRTGKAASAASHYALAAKGAGRLREAALRQVGIARFVAGAAIRKAPPVKTGN